MRNKPTHLVPKNHPVTHSHEKYYRILINRKSIIQRRFIYFIWWACLWRVCKSIRPQLKAMLDEHFPKMQSVYVDCETSPEICAQFSVFSLPVVKVFIEDKLIAEEFGSFSISQLKETLLQTIRHFEPYLFLL